MFIKEKWTYLFGLHLVLSQINLSKSMDFEAMTFWNFFSSFLKFCLFTYFSRIFRHECNSQILENLCSVDQSIQNSSLIYELKLRFNLIFFNTMDQKRQKFEMEVTFYLISKSQFFSILVLSWWEVGHDRHNAENTIINSNFHSSVVFSFST